VATLVLLKEITEQKLLLTPFFKTWKFEVRLGGHTEWQSLSCLRHEDQLLGEYCWTLVPEGEGPPLLINTHGVLVTGGNIDKDLRLMLASSQQVYVQPPGVNRLNHTTVTKGFSISGAKVRKRA
jgi:hypothetical protein